MKLTFICLLLLTCFLLQAQTPIINRTNYFEIGDSVLLYHKYDTSLNSFTVGPAGANVLWDFSNMDFNHPSVLVDTLFYISPAGTPFYPNHLSADYSQATLCFIRKTEPFSTENNEYNYYFSSNDSIAFIGRWADNGGTERWEDHCTDFIKELIFPLSYPTHFIDSYARLYNDVSGSGNHFVTGNNSVTVDGYGSLITPDGTTVNNIIRIHSVLSARDSNDLFGISNYTRHQYRWYSSDKKGYILSFEMSEDSSVIETANYQRQFDLNTSIGDIRKNDNSFIIYPNPNNGQFTISTSPYEKAIRIGIFNSLGQQVYSGSNSDQLLEKQIELSTHEKGIYFIKMNTGGVNYIKSIVIK